MLHSHSLSLGNLKEVFRNVNTSYFQTLESSDDESSVLKISEYGDRKTAEKFVSFQVNVQITFKL